MITARMAPVWMAMSNTLALASSKPSSAPARIRWPVLEMGRNSVRPSTTPMMAALTSKQSTRTRARKASLTRVVTLPVAMGGLSLYGTVSAFGSAPTVLLPWALAMGTVLAISLRQSAPAAARFNATRREFDLPGSWVPMVLILGIFLTKYAVGVATAMQPAPAR
jgi:hypothetical protein